jgi:hypothetical protein
VVEEEGEKGDGSGEEEKKINLIFLVTLFYWSIFLCGSSMLPLFSSLSPPSPLLLPISK